MVAAVPSAALRYFTAIWKPGCICNVQQRHVLLRFVMYMAILVKIMIVPVLLFQFISFHFVIFIQGKTFS